MKHRCMLLSSLLAALCAPSLVAATVERSGPAIQIRIENNGPVASEILLAKVGSSWVEALSAGSSSIHIRTDDGDHLCNITGASTIENGLLVIGDCIVGHFEQHLLFSAEEDVLNVSTRVTIQADLAVHSIEDRYNFLPLEHATSTDLEGPLDFVWSQNIKSEQGDLIPTNAFKSPAVMLQQGEIFTALMPHLSDRHVDTLAMDLDVTSEKFPWISYGAIPSSPHGHSYFRRSATAKLAPLDHAVEYSYSLVISRQPSKQGYRRIVRRLWSEAGHPALLNSPSLQQNTIRPELSSFASWREDAWKKYADRQYRAFPCGKHSCGSLMNNRSVTGDWEHTEPDAWFNAWFQSLRTAYGWYLHGQETHDPAMMAKAESVLNLALSAPQQQGAFPTIYLIGSKTWIPDDGWASYSEDYHAFCMSWTAYWMLRWATDLTPERKAEVLHFVQPYGDFLLKHQQPSGVIPSWYDAHFIPRQEFRDFNAETAASALLLVTLGTSTGDQRYIAGAERAMNFITREVVPRQRWFDFETFRSCARKDYSFFDRWTAQFPQNNLAEIQAPQTWLALFQATHKQEYLDRGTASLDYLLLTQQVWSNPAFTPPLLGGFTTQNTDAEWSDARQGYIATLLFDYSRQTGNPEYLERSVAASRSTFAVAPWENWAHTGYLDEPGAMTGFHWGTGSAMTSVEIMAPMLGDAFINLATESGVGFDECSLTHLQVAASAIHFTLESAARQRTFLVRFAGLNPAQHYRISANESPDKEILGSDLLHAGFRVEPLGPLTKALNPKQEPTK